MPKTLLVTGASSDIGIALIRATHQDYDRVLAHYCHTGDRLNALQEEIGEKLVPLQADFCDLDATVAFASRAAAELPAHIVHLPAAPLENIKFAKADWSHFDRDVSAAFRSACVLLHKLLPPMAKRGGGKVVFLLSYNVLNQPPIKYAVPYTSVKYALLGLMKGLAAEYADKGVTVNGVSPAMIETRFLRDVPELIIEKNAQESPIGRNLTVQDVLPTIRFLLSDGAACVTGQNIGVTAGR